VKAYYVPLERNFDQSVEAKAVLVDIEGGEDHPEYARE